LHFSGWRALTRTARSGKSISPGLASVGSKLAGSTIAVILLVAVGAYLEVSQYQGKSLLQGKEVGASAVTRLFADSCTVAVIFDDATAVQDALTTLGRNEEVEYAAVWEVDDQGRVGRRFGELRRGPEVIVTRAPTTTEIQRFDDRVVLTSPARDQAGRRVAVVAIAFSLARENRAIASATRTTLLLSIGVAVGLMVLLLVMARVVIVGPLGKLVLAAKELEEGGRGEVEVRSNDEVGQLARAFRSMASAIKVREERINTRNRDMRLVLDNVGQGFITLDVEGTVAEEHSKIIDEWFGAAGRSVKFWEYLQTIDARAADWFELGWTAIQDNILPLVLCLDQLPAQVNKDGRTFELAYRPIMDGERLDKTIVVITDVTVRIERERAEQSQKEMMSIFRRMLSDRQALDQFFEEADSRVDMIMACEPTASALLRHHIHTLKGTCALFEIDSLSSYCHDLENRLADPSARITTADKATLRQLWENVSKLRAQLTSGADRGGAELDRAEHAAFLADLRGCVAHERLLATAAAWLFEPAAKRLLLIGDQIQTLASRLGRASVRVVCEPTTLRLPPRKWAPFWSVFAHVIRNTVDHGIETAEQRIAAGKSEGASVTLAVLKREGHVEVTIHDDGPGVDWGKIAVRAKEQGLPHLTHTDLEQALFSDGVTSRDVTTSTSGRGVGLAAVRQLVRDLGGHIEIRSEIGRGASFRFILPSSMLSDESELRAPSYTPAPAHA
jgi:two-component system chemotaxis sensor kinase CheA